jgi:TatD DNase family protein
LRAALDSGHYVSFSGMVTFKNWRDDAAVRLVPADRLLVETDAPYLAPVPHRGRRNEPAYVGETARRLAAVRGVPEAQLVAETGANARRVFGARLPA